MPGFPRPTYRTEIAAGTEYGHVVLKELDALAGELSSYLTSAGFDEEGGFTLRLLRVDPVAPANDTCWFFASGTGPTEISFRVRIAGVTTEIPLASVP